MLITLGVLGAALLLLFFLPVYRRRIERLTVEGIRRTLPLTEAEIRADKDNLRAGYAIDIHARDAKLDVASLAVARQTIEINRREARIAELEARLSGKQLEVSEHENARRVLIQTITERLPKVEMRLAEARKSLFQRDRELNELKALKDRQVSALEEARQINVQQAAELSRLKAAVETRAARNRKAAVDPGFDMEVSLRAQIEDLRAKIRAKDRDIEVLNDRVAVAERVEKRNSQLESQLENEVQVLKASLADAQDALAASRASDTGLSAGSQELLRKLQEQQEQIALLKSEAHGSGLHTPAEVHREERTQAKLRIGRLEADVETHIATIERLKAELAQENERHAQQVATLRDEIRLLSEQAAAPPQSYPPNYEPRKSLRERINGPRLPRAGASASDTEKSPAPARGGMPALRVADVASPAVSDALGQAVATNAASAVTTQEAAPGLANKAAAIATAPRRARLLDRIIAAQKPSG